MDNDVCLMRIGALSAHFTGYQPSVSASEEFCEEIPEIAESVFVVDFLEEVLNEMPVDFRIIKNDFKAGLSANWEDIQSLEDLEAATLYYQAPAQHQDGVLTANYEFVEAGNFIGIITAQHPTQDKTFRAIFPFRVGAAGFLDYLPYLIGVLAFLEAFYWLSSGGGLKERMPQIKRTLRI
jgi:hypothetical protein